MAAAKRNILIEKKATFHKRDQLLIGTPTHGALSTKDQIAQDITDGVLVPVDLTGATIAATWNSGNSSGSFTSSIEAGTDGYYNFSLTKEQTTGLTWSTGTYAVLITFPSGEARRVREGNVRVD